MASAKGGVKGERERERGQGRLSAWEGEEAWSVSAFEVDIMQFD